MSRDLDRVCLCELICGASALNRQVFGKIFAALSYIYTLSKDIIFVTIQNNKKIVYLHKRNFEISNSRHADDNNTNWSYAMLSRGTKNAS